MLVGQIASIGKKKRREPQIFASKWSGKSRIKPERAVRWRLGGKIETYSEESTPESVMIQIIILRW